MPTVPGSVLDGSPGYGSQVITFSTAGAFLADNIAVTRQTQEAYDMKTDGEPNRARYTLGRASLTCTLQAPSTFAGWPTFGETATLTLDTNYGAELYVVMQPETALTNDATSLRKINVTMKKVYNGSVSTVATPAS